MKKITVPLKGINEVIGELRFPIYLIDEIRFLNERPFCKPYPVIETAYGVDAKEMKKVIRNFTESKRDGELTVFMKTLISIKILRKNGIITLQTDRA